MTTTPGPWVIGGELISHNFVEIATVMHCYAGKKGEPVNRNSPVFGVADANARLIAAAPELLEVAKDILANGYDQGRRIKLRAAVTKAEGKG